MLCIDWYREDSGRSVSLYCVCRALSEYVVQVPEADLLQVVLPALMYEQDDGQSHSLSQQQQVGHVAYAPNFLKYNVIAKFYSYLYNAVYYYIMENVNNFVTYLSI